MKIVTSKNLARSIIPLLLILFPFLFSSLMEELFEKAGQLSVMAVLIVFIVFSFLFKRSFCGFMCLVGAGQRIVGYLGSSLLKKRIAIPAALDKYLRSIKFVLLAGLTALSIAKGKFLLLVSIDDVPEQFGILLPGLAWVSIVLMIVTIVGTFFIDNFFCKYLCLQGALAGVAGRLSPSGIVRNEDKCINCKLCTKKCPSNLEVHGMKKVKSIECLNCQKCVIACPKKGALTNRLAGIKIPVILFMAIAGIMYVLLTYIIPLFIRTAT